MNRYFSRGVLFIALSFGFVTAASAKTMPPDTVHSRMATFVLPDSSEIMYEMGWMRLTQHGADRFLTFGETTGDNFFNSVPFVATGRDTLAINRFASCNRKGWQTIVRGAPIYGAYATALANTSDSLDNDALINPNRYSFGPHSTVRFLLQIRSVRDDIVLNTLDTLSCFRDGRGKMHYQIFPTSLNVREGIALNGLRSGVSYYFHVERKDDLPRGVAFVDSHFEEIPHNLGSTELYIMGDQTGYPNQKR